MEDTLELLPAVKITPEYTRIPLEDLPPDEELLGPAPTSGFIHSIETIGVLMPIIAVREGGRYRLAAGRSRVKASRALSLADIPAVVYPDGAEVCDVLTLVENQQRGQNVLADLEAIEALIVKGASPTDIKRATGMPMQTIAARLSLASLSKELRQVWRDGGINESTAVLLSKSSKPIQRRAYLHYKQGGGLTLKTIKRLRRAVTAEQLKAIPDSVLSTPGIPRIDEASATTLANVIIEILNYVDQNLGRPYSETFRNIVKDHVTLPF